MIYKIYRVFILFIFLASCKSEIDITEEDQNQNSGAKNNVLLIIADDMGLDSTVGYNIGNQKPNMPNLEKLINSGVKFNNVWANPVCSPTRSTIITGKYGYRTSVLTVDNALSTSETSLFKYLKENSDYNSALIDKWHLSSKPTDHNHPSNMGIDYYAGIIGGGIQNYYSWSFSKNGNSSQSTEYSTTKLTNEAIEWINNQDSSWFMWLAYNAPHTPFHLPPQNLHSQGELDTNSSSIDANPLPYYLAMIESIDTEFGRLKESINEEVLNNTTIIFIGDNGTPNQVTQQFNSRRVKGTLYKGGINVPMIISGSQVSRKNEEEDATFYEFEPEEDEILEDLLPKNVSTQIFKAFLENAASEQGSRMTAMDNATRNAGDLVDKLTINYNRSRQASITKELIEIISGAESL